MSQTATSSYNALVAAPQHSLKDGLDNCSEVLNIMYGVLLRDHTLWAVINGKRNVSYGKFKFIFYPASTLKCNAVL
jgi:hypothetical protein